MVSKRTTTALGRLKWPPSQVIAVITVLLVSGGGVVYWFASRRPGVTATELPGAQLIPADAVAAIALSTDAQQWQQLRRFGVPESQTALDQQLAGWRQRLLGNQGLRFKDDIQPWVGSTITLAVLPSASAPPAPGTIPEPETLPPLLVILPIADGEIAQATLQDRRESPPSDPAPEAYRGVSVYPWGDNAYGALLNSETLVLSNQREALKAAIDVTKGRESLGDLPGFKQGFAPLGNLPALGRLYLDVPNAVNVLGQNAQPPLTGNEFWQQPRGLAAALVLAPEGIQLQGISWFQGRTDYAFQDSNAPHGLLAHLPAESLLAVTTSHFQTFWQSFAAGEQFTALLPITAEGVTTNLQAGLGLTLETDILPWLAGPVAVAVPAPALPQAEAEPAPAPNSAPSEAPDSGPPIPEPTLVMALQVSDRRAAEQTLEKLNQVMTLRYGYGAETELIQSFTLHRWVRPDGALGLSYGWQPGEVLLVAVGSGVLEQLGPQLRQSLDSNRTLQLTTGQAPRPNSGYFFLDIAAMAKVQQTLFLPPMAQEGLISSQAMEALGVTATVLSPRQVRYDLFLELPRGRAPGPLPSPTPDPVPGPEPGPEEQSSP